jgi:hypothetical protein
MYIPNSMNWEAVSEKHYFYLPTDGVDGRNGWEATPYDSFEVGSSTVPHSVHEDAAPHYMDEITLGYDHLFTNDIAASGFFIWRTWRDMLTAWDPDDDGDAVWQNVETDDYGTKFREYMAVVFDARKRPTADNLFLNANFTYVLMEEGLGVQSVVSGGYGISGEQTAANADEWWRDFSNFDGGSPEWRAKLQGTYFFPNNWYAGLTIDYRSGYLYTSHAFDYWKYIASGWARIYDYPNGWGDLGTGPAVPSVDLQVGFEQTIDFPFEVPFTDNNILIGLYINFDNLINFEGATHIEDSMDSTNYGREVSWMEAREYRLGFRVEL